MNWLLLRGLAREQRHWGRLPVLLGARIPGASVYLLDHPGAGTEHTRPSPTSIRGITSDVRERWLALAAGTQGPCGLVGISLGGMVAMDWAGAFPDDFGRVVIANSSAANLSVPWRRMDLGKLPGVARALVTTDRKQRERRILDMTTCLASDEQKDALAEAYARYHEERPMPRSTALRQLYAATRFVAPEALRPSVLVLSGARDPFTDPTCPRRIAAHFDAPLVTHPDAGHDLSVDAPEWMADEIAGWTAATA